MHLRRRQQVTAVGVAVAAMALSLAACSSSSSSSAAAGGSSSPAAGSSSSSSAALSGTLNGSGSTFQPTYQETASSSFKSVQSGMTVNYGSGGSGKGRTDLASGVTNFAGSDSPIPAAETANFKGKTVLYFPVMIAPITLSYNLSSLSKPLQLSAPVIADIFQGKITTWNNSAIAADNPGVTLPSTPITIAVRSDSSGTTQNFSLFLKTATPTLDARHQLDHQVALHGPRRQRQRRGGVDRQVHPRGHRVRGLLRRQGLRADVRFDQEQGRQLRRAFGVRRLRRRGRRHRQAEPDVPARSGRTGAQAYPITDQSWVLVYETQPNANDAAMLKAYIGYLLGPMQQMSARWATRRCRPASTRWPQRSSARSRVRY